MIITLVEILMFKLPILVKLSVTFKYFTECLSLRTATFFLIYCRIIINFIKSSD